MSGREGDVAWGDVQTAGPSASWAELPENGWGALIGWSARRGNLGRRRSSDAGRTVTGYIDHSGGRTHFEEPFTAADRLTVDDAIDAYLRDADIPPRPRGYVWMVRVPESHASPEAFLTDVEAAVLSAAAGITHPGLLRPIFAAVLADFYARPA